MTNDVVQMQYPRVETVLVSLVLALELVQFRLRNPQSVPHYLLLQTQHLWKWWCFVDSANSGLF